MTNLLDQVTKGHVLFHHKGGSVIPDSFCVFDKKAVKMIKGSMHIIPTVGDFEGWFQTESMEIIPINRNIQSGMVSFTRPVFHGIFKMNLSFNAFNGSNVLIGLFSEDFKTRIIFLLKDNNKFVWLSKFYSGFTSVKDGEYVNDIKSRIYSASPLNLNIEVYWDKNSIFIYHNKRLVNAIKTAIDVPLFPFIALNISKPNIPYPEAKPLIINSFTHEPK